ncbi:MAG: ABC transporter ATP-binding protein/permease [Gemmataceae bacterium]
MTARATDEPAPLNRRTARRFVGAVKQLLTSEVRYKAWGLIAFLAVFALAVSALNVVNSYVGRDFMTAIAQRDMNGFVKFAVYYVGVFAALTAVSVLYRFSEERLGLLWRAWLTTRSTTKYLSGRCYYRLRELDQVDNPDQRIADDIRAFTSTTLSFTLIFLNGSLAAISFSGVLWAISPTLFGVAVTYALVGTVATIYLGRPLIGLNYHQSDREADFRASLIHVRENAESIAVSRNESRMTSRLLRRIEELTANFRKITSVNRNLGFFTTGYNYLIQIIPALLIAPKFIRGEVEFGVITQSAMAFAQLLGAFSLIVNQFGSISAFAAVVARLGALAEAIETDDEDKSSIQATYSSDRIAFDELTLRSQQNDSILIKGLCATIPHGTRLLVAGPNEEARNALFRALGGFRSNGDGAITRPVLDATLFLPQRPYLSPGRLRDTLLPFENDNQIQNGGAPDTLEQLGLTELVSRLGGLDAEYDWSNKLSLSEQQQLAITRLILAQPRFAVIDRASTTLGTAQLRGILELLRRRSISVVTFEQSDDTADLHDAVLELNLDSWRWRNVTPEAAQSPLTVSRST